MGWDKIDTKKYTIALDLMGSNELFCRIKDTEKFDPSSTEIFEIEEAPAVPQAVSTLSLTRHYNLC